MARQCKEGIDYFPLNIDMDEEDERVFMMEAEFGERSFAVLIKLLMVIYRHSYYYPWTEREQVFFSRKKNIELNYCREIVDFLLHNGFFCKHLFDKYQILTSRGIQKRYFPACVRRKKVPVIREFLLLDMESELNDNINIVFVNINSVYANNMSTSCGQESDNCEESTSKSTQTRRDETRRDESKREETRRNKTRVNEMAVPPSASPPAANSPPGKAPNNDHAPMNSNGFKPREQQLDELAEHLRKTDKDGWNRFLKQHPEYLNKRKPDIPEKTAAMAEAPRWPP